MCGRMTMTPRDLDQITALLGVEPNPELAATYRPRFNLPPTDLHMMVVGGARKQLVAARWGFGRDPRAPAGGGAGSEATRQWKPQINARGETVATNGLFKRAFQERRCLIPADGFFEWAGAAGRRRPIWFHAHPGQLLLFAGIYDDNGFVVVTTAANDDVAPVHDRMPAILAGDAADRWLAHPDPTLLRPAPRGALIVTPVSSRANSVGNDDEACLLPPPKEDDDPKQLRLL